jgi:hypothetical protein
MAADPFARYQNAFQSIVPPQGVSVQPTAPVQISPEQVAKARYDSFLMDQRINPNTIGTATIDRDTGQMVVPSIAQEQKAIHYLNQANAAKGDLVRAAHWARKREDADGYLKYKQAVRDADNVTRGTSYESKLRYFLAMAQAKATPSANGFA